MNSVRQLIALALCLVAPACYSIENAKLEAFEQFDGVALTQGDGPTGAKPLLMIAVHRSGFYIIGLLPIIPVSLHGAIDRLVRKARDIRADGVCHIQFDYVPTSLFKFSSLGLPDWTASISITGMAYRMPKAAEPAK